MLNDYKVTFAYKENFQLHAAGKKGTQERRAAQHRNALLADSRGIVTICACLLLRAFQAAAQNQLAPNQTQGFGNGRLVTFTYLQNFDCVDQPLLDLDFNGTKAESDPNEMQTPICQVVTEPTADPTGGDIKHTAHLYVLVPMFSVDHDTNPADAMACPNGGRPGELCGAALGNALISLFGFIPEAWKTKVNSAITTQCPDPNNPVPGTCTMHGSSVDLSQLLVAVGKSTRATAPVFLPTPNHSDIVDNSRVNTGPIWWEVRPVLIMSESDWPTADGSAGITSAKAMDEAEAAGRAIEVGSNFFLFFSSEMSSMSTAANHMHANPSGQLHPDSDIFSLLQRNGEEHMSMKAMQH